MLQLLRFSEPVTAGNETTDSKVTASNGKYFGVYSIEPALGRLFDESDNRGAKKVAVLGSDAAIDLFFSQNPIGRKIKVGSTSFTVIGVAEPLGTAFFQNQDEQIYIPLETAKQITNQDYVNAVVFLRTVAADLAQKDVESKMRELNNITDPDDDDFVVRNSQQAQEILGSVSIGLTAFITFIATISLVVGGIGIMNIMLVAVTERTKEIGLRKAIGAKRKDILLQFLVESMVLTFIGGLIGMIGGITFSFVLALLINKFLAEYVFAISLIAIIVALGMALITGFAFGVYPAKKAAELSPMEALRYE